MSSQLPASSFQLPVRLRRLARIGLTGRLETGNWELTPLPRIPTLNQFDLKGRRAVVTGAAQGFGRAITERLLASGASVALWDLDEARPRGLPAS